MENNTQKSTFILSLAIVALAGFAFWQQQEIGQIKNAQIVSAPNSASNTNRNANGVAQTPVFNPAQATRDSLLTTKIISGTVVSSTASQVVIKTQMVDLSALDTFDFKKSQVPPELEKNLTIAITSSTVVSGGTLVVGGLVSIQTKEPVYGGGVLTAVSISVPVPLKAGGGP